MPLLLTLSTSRRALAFPIVLLLALACGSPAGAAGAGEYFRVEYAAASEPAELQMGVTYTLWIPAGVQRLRGVIVHQHGCGVGACQGGATAAYDLHWQLLAAKWMPCSALYHQAGAPRSGAIRATARTKRFSARSSISPNSPAMPN